MLFVYNIDLESYEWFIMQDHSTFDMCVIPIHSEEVRRLCSIFNVVLFKPGANESQKTLNKCETRNKTRLRHPETINSVPLNSVLRIQQTGV